MSNSIFYVVRLTGLIAVLVCWGATSSFAQENTVTESERGLALIYGSEGVAQDVSGGVAVLSDAAAEGDIAAQRVLGQQLVGGWVMPRDVARGRTLLEAAAASGDTEASLILGTFLVYGIGLPRAIEAARVLFDALAEQDDGRGLQVYGESLMWSLRDPEQAEAYLTRAGDMGQGDAWAVLVEGAMYGYLGGGTKSRSKFEGYAERARSAGNERIEVLDATRQMWGITLHASGPKTLEKLETAADNGNAEAARYVISLVRDGNGLNVRKDTDRAEALAEKYAHLLTADEQWRYDFSIAVAKTKKLDAFGGLQERLITASQQMDDGIGKDLYKANPNFVIFVLQSKMKEAGLYRVKLDGLAGEKTLRSLVDACLTMLDQPDCDRGVLSADVIGALMTAL